ncbi:hypothetical protein LOK49_LG13G00079 [Camellia lanceoleosa]|uniref:Uncharacterized protein n=1 Tax=Camellia lanceoleosa TaxID=1840588 RepID=A0ACC0FER6_9ERIC|nr:hypothetical protein LOK49_LG13G00079 [Camellia lanceoleosa]
MLEASNCPVHELRSDIIGFLNIYHHDPCPILLKNGPYGFYVQLGEDRKGYLPKRASVSQVTPNRYGNLVANTTAGIAGGTGVMPGEASNCPVHELRSDIIGFLNIYHHDPCPILLKNGPYGFYVQLGEDRKGYLPKRASVSNYITLEDAIELLRYPATSPVVLKLAKFGFSIRHRRTIAPVPKVTPNRYGNLVANTTAGIAGGTGVMPGGAWAGNVGNDELVEQNKANPVALPYHHAAPPPPLLYHLLCALPTPSLLVESSLSLEL